MQKFVLVVFAFFSFHFLEAQNLIKNPGLELLDTSIKTSNSWDIFQICQVPAWFNPGITTTDYFNSDGKHFDLGSLYFNHEMKAHTGNCYAGIYLDNSKWKEYIGVELVEPLIAGKNYRLEMYLSISRKCLIGMNSMQINFWDTTKVQVAYEVGYPKICPKYPPINITKTAQFGMVGAWVKVSVDFTAIGGEKSLVMGYFDDYYRTVQLPVTAYNKGRDPFAFYFIDDVSLMPVEGSQIERTVRSRPIIYFDVNKAVIKPEYFAALNDVVDRMKANARLRIEVDGYTDIDASDSFNLKLSQRRAQAVADYIISKGIEPSRISIKWFAEQVQVSDEKALNRRVEFRYFEN